MDEEGTSLSYTGLSLRFLSNLYDWMGNYKKMEPLLKRALVLSNSVKTTSN